MVVDIENEIRAEVPLAPLTTIGIGGPARWLVRARSETMLREALAWAEQRALPVFFLGGGSNVLFADEGFEGLVVVPAMDHRRVREEGDSVLVDVAAGMNWDALVAWSVQQNCAGIECLSGIPGNVGAAPIQNIGAYGQELAETLVSLRALEVATGRVRAFGKGDCAFAYRDSFFKRHPGRFLVTEITLALKRNGPATIRYGDLEQRLGKDASLSETRDTVLAIRRKKSMVHDPDDRDAHSCGSFFTNPILDDAALGETTRRLRAAGHDTFPRWPAGAGRTKLSAAWLIERAGFAKGYGAGPIGLSRKHCLAIVNRGGGTAAEVRDLARRIRNAVRECFAVTLVPEPLLMSSRAPTEI